MQISKKTVFIIIISILTLWLLHSLRSVLTPFILAAIFAYILNPLINFLTHRIKLPRAISILLIYLLIICTLGFVVLKIGSALREESGEITSESKTILSGAEYQIQFLPDWAQESARDTIDSLKFFTIIPQGKILSIFSGAFGRIINLFVFILSAFYFLKDGSRFLKKISELIPDNQKDELFGLAGKINKVLGDYLRGQLFLIILMSSISFIALSFLGVRFALAIAIFTGFAELIPWIGPFASGAVAVIVAMFDNFPVLGFSPIMEGLIIAAVYFLLRQLEDFFVIPQVMGKLTKLHPLVVLFVVLAGGHLFGALGLILAVPVTASTRILLEYLWGKVNIPT